MKNFRIIAPTVLFLLLSAVGTVWLIGVARGPSAASPRFEEVGDDPGNGTAATATGERPAPSEVPTSPGSTTAGTAATPTGAGARIPAKPDATRTTAPATEGALAPPIPSRAIRVGGVTLDDTSPRTHCYLVRNTDFDEPVRITRIAAGSSKVVVKADLCAGTTAQSEAGDWTPTFACRAGSVLQPGGNGCYTGIEPASASLDGPLPSTITLTLRARCTSATGHPCGDSGSPAPSSDRPVDVSWTESYDGTLCYLAGGTPPDGIFC